MTNDGKLFISFGAAAWNVREAVAVETLGGVVSRLALDERKVLAGTYKIGYEVKQSMGR